MTATLFCKVGELKGAEFAIADEATIGRSADNDVVLARGLVSSRHARIYFDRDRGGYYVEDLGSLNGTRLDGIALTRPERLGDLAILTFAGSFDFVFQDLGALPRRAAPAEAAAGHHTMIESEPVLPPELLAGAGGEPAPERVPTGKTMIEREAPLLPDALAPETVPAAGSDSVPPGTQIDRDWLGIPAALAGDAEADVPAATDSAPGSHPPAAAAEADAGGPRFVLETPDLEGRMQRLELRPGKNLVGRLGDCQLKLDNPSVSRRHAVLNLAGDRVTVCDLGSSNHTYLGDDRVEGEVEVPAGATLRFGAVPAKLVAE